MMKVRHIDLFSGVGGFSLSAERVWGCNHKTLSFCEIDPFCQKVLKKHWPDVPIISDIRDMKGTDYANVTLLTGGFPCQPFSCAGKRRGTKDDRYLWPQMLEIIHQAKPTWIIAENVTGIKSMVKSSCPPVVESRTLTRFKDHDHYVSVLSRQEEMLLESICQDLETEGYEIQPIVVPACAVGAPHRRDRVWIVANSRDNSGRDGQQEGFGRNGRGEFQTTERAAQAVEVARSSKASCFMADTQSPECKFSGNTRAQGGQDLQTVTAIQAGLLPMPTTQDAKNNGSESQQNRNTKPLNAIVGGKLNPQWVEWLMGYPIGWTDLEHSETQ